MQSESTFFVQTFIHSARPKEVEILCMSARSVLQICRIPLLSTVLGLACAKNCEKRRYFFQLVAMRICEGSELGAELGGL
jgi:hypothetical protein